MTRHALSLALLAALSLAARRKALESGKVPEAVVDVFEGAPTELPDWGNAVEGDLDSRWDD